MSNAFSTSLVAINVVCTAQPTMEEPTSSKRSLPSSDEEEWELVDRKRNQRQRRKPPGPGPKPHQATTSTRPSWPKYRVFASKDFPCSYTAVRALERAYPELKVDAKPNLDAQFILTPLNQGSADLLRAVREIDGTAIPIEVLRPEMKLSKAVIMAFPIELGLDLLDRVPNLSCTKRCRTQRKIATRQVQVFFRGPPPEKIDLGNWGSFRVRQWHPEPIRCYNCQRWGHYGFRCTYPARCGVCSRNHPSKECINCHKNGENTTPRCPNCSKSHHAWNLRCPARQERLKRTLPKKPPQQKKSTANPQQPQQPTSKPPAPRQQRTFKPRKTPRTKIQIEGRAVSRPNPCKADPPPPASSLSIPVEAVKSLLRYMAEHMAATLEVPMDTTVITVLVDGLIQHHLSGSKDPRLMTAAVQPAPTPEPPAIPERTPPQKAGRSYHPLPGEPYQPWMEPRPEVPRAPREFADVSDDETEEDCDTSQEIVEF